MIATMTDHSLNMSRIGSRLLCLLLCVTAWRGPLPLLHDHDAMADLSARTAHSVQFHADNSITCQGLHWHFGFPEDVHGAELPADQMPPELSLFASVLALQVTELTLPWNSDDDSLSETLDGAPGRALGVPASSASCSTFFSSLLNGSALATFTGVWRV
jgi:hypothetical protein